MFGLGVIDLELNHPFFYFVYDHETKTVLFAGRLSSTGTTPAGAFSASSQPENAVPLGLAGASTQPPSHAAPPNTSGKQPPASTPRSTHRQSYAPPANAQSYPAQSSQQSYAAPSSSFGSSSQPSYANVADPGYRPEAPRPGSGVESLNLGPKPSNLGAVNHRYNPQAPTATAPKRYPHGDIEYPASTDNRNYAKQGYQPYRA